MFQGHIADPLPCTQILLCYSIVWACLLRLCEQPGTFFLRYKHKGYTVFFGFNVFMIFALFGLIIKLFKISLLIGVVGIQYAICSAITGMLLHVLRKQKEEVCF